MTEPTRTFPQLETPRLLLREIGLQDSDALFRYYSDPDVTRYFMEPLADPQQAVEIAREYEAYFRSGTGLVWGIALKGSPELIGTCGYEVVSAYDKRAEIGCDLAQEHWGQGLMTEAMRAAIEHGFVQMGLNRIQAYVFAENARSLRLFRRLGFQTEGVLREHRWFKGRFWDNVLLALLKQDWQAGSVRGATAEPNTRRISDA